MRLPSHTSILFKQAVDQRLKQRFLKSKPRPSRCLWIAGEVIACVEELRNRQWLSPIHSMFRVVAPGIIGRYDDFRWDDPIPLLAELSYYGMSFIRTGGDSNPVTPGMLK